MNLVPSKSMFYDWKLYHHQMILFVILDLMYIQMNNQIKLTLNMKAVMWFYYTHFKNLRSACQ